MKRILTMLLTLVCVLSLTTLAAIATAEATAQTAQYDLLRNEDDVPVPSHAYGEDAAEDEDSMTETPQSADYSPSLSAGAEGTGEIASPLDYWNRNGYPDDISFAFEAGGEMAENGTVFKYWEIGVVNASSERKAELTAMFADTCLITFEDAQYSYNEREAVLDEIITEVKENHDGNYVMGMLIRNTDRVYLVVKDDVCDEYAARYTERYGDMVQVARESEQSILYVEETGGLTDGGNGVKHNHWLMPTLICIALLLSAALFLGRKRLVPAIQTTGGQIVTAKKPPNRAQTVAAVRESAYTPGDGVFAEIMEKLKK